MGDGVQELARRLEELEELPVQEHPEVLEAVLAALVEELDALARSTAG